MNTEERPPKTEDPGFAPLTFDAEEYRPYLTECNLTEAEERQLLQALWSVMVGFVDLGFRIHPVQQAAAERNGDSLPVDSGSVLGSDDQSPKPTNNKTARCTPAFTTRAARKGKKP